MQTSHVRGRMTLEAVVSFDGAVLGIHHLDAGQTLTLGPASDDPAERPDYPSADLAVRVPVASHGAVHSVAFPVGTAGEVVLPDGSTRTLAQLLDAGLCESVAGFYSYVLPAGARVRLSLGALEVRVAEAMLQERTVPRRGPVDWRTQRYMAGSLLLNAVVIGLAMVAPPDPHALASSDLSRLSNEALRTRFVPVVVEVKQPPPDKGTGGGPTKAIKDTLGHVGSPQSRRPVITKITERQTGPAQMRGTDLRAEVRKTGLVAIFGDLRERGALSEMLRADTSALGQDADAVLAGLQASTGDVGWGTNGASLVDTGPGRGGGCVGSDCGTIGVQLSRICTGANCGTGTPGNGKGPIGTLARMRHVPEGPIVDMSPPVVSNGLDRDTVRRVIRSRMNEFKYCYEQQLVAKPELAGRVVVSFVIGKDGRVVTAGARESTMHNEQVHGCLSQAVQRLTFPQPNGAGLVQVSYPFIFHTAGR